MIFLVTMPATIAALLLAGSSDLRISILIGVMLLALPLIGTRILANPTSLALLYVAVFGLYHRARIVFGPAPIYLVEVLAGIGLIILVFQVLNQRARLQVLRLTPSGFLVILFLVFTMPSMFRVLSDIPNAGMEWYYMVARSVIAVLIFFVFSNFVKTEKDLRSIIVLLYYTAVLNGVWGILQVLPATASLGEQITQDVAQVFGLRDSFSLSPNFVPGFGEVNRAVAGFNATTIFGGYMAVLLPVLALSLLAADAPKVVVPPTLGLPVVFTGFLLTFARHAVLALGIALIFLWIFTALYLSHVNNRIITTIIASALIVLLIIYILPGPVRSLLGQRFSALSSTNALQEDKNYTARVDQGFERFFRDTQENDTILLWGQSLIIAELQEHGIGSQYQYLAFISNSWVLLIVDSGLVSAIVFVILFALVVGKLASQVVRASHGTPSWLFYTAVGYLTSLVALAVAIAGDNYWTANVFLRGFKFVMLGLGVAITALLASRNRSSEQYLPSSSPANRNQRRATSPREQV